MCPRNTSSNSWGVPCALSHARVALDHSCCVRKVPEALPRTACEGRAFLLQCRLRERSSMSCSPGRRLHPAIPIHPATLAPLSPLQGPCDGRVCPGLRVPRCCPEERSSGTEGWDRARTWRRRAQEEPRLAQEAQSPQPGAAGADGAHSSGSFPATRSRGSALRMRLSLPGGLRSGHEAGGTLCPLQCPARHVLRARTSCPGGAR